MGLHFLIAALCLAPVPANTSAWELLEESENLKVWRREVRGSSTQQIKVETVVDGTSRAIWKALRDVARYHEWMPNMAEARILSEKGDTRIVYQRVSPPIVDDRDYTLRVVAFEDHQTGVYEQRLFLANDQGPKPIDGVVRVLVVEGGWLLEPVGKNKTRILYWLHTDPGGSVPSWAINFGQQYTLPDQIDALRQRAGESAP